jgi:hypothetical protein
VITADNLEHVIARYLDRPIHTGSERNPVDAHDLANHLADYLNSHGVPVTVTAPAIAPARQLLTVSHRDGISRIYCQGASCLWHWPLERGASELNGRSITSAVEHALRRHSETVTTGPHSTSTT